MATKRTAIGLIALVRAVNELVHPKLSPINSLDIAKVRAFKNEHNAISNSLQVVKTKEGKTGVLDA